jgi:hypothetical protein
MGVDIRFQLMKGEGWKRFFGEETKDGRELFKEVERS